MSQFFASGGKSIGLNFRQQTSNEYSGLISFRMNSVDLLAVQGTQESSPTPQFKTMADVLVGSHTGLMQRLCYYIDLV